jgi:uncharacterized membrane protein
MTYLAFKVVHVLGVVLFLGNIVVTGVWKTLADRTGDPRTVAYAQHLVTLTDWVFTLGGLILILIGAYGMVWTGGLNPLGPLWLIAGQGLFVASGISGRPSSFRFRSRRRAWRTALRMGGQSRSATGG